MDEELVRLCKQGEESAFEKLITRYHHPLFNYIFYYTKDRQLTEDITQETFEKMINNIPKYESKKGAKFSTWLFTIARNTMTDEFRKRKIRSFVDIEGCASLPFVGGADIEETVIRKDEIRRVKHAIEHLPNDTKSIVYLRFYMDFSYKEISQILSFTPEKIKWRLHDAMEKIRLMMKGKEVNADEGQ